MSIKGLRQLNLRMYWQYVIMYLIIIGSVIIMLTPLYNEALSILKRVYLQEANNNLICSADNFEKKIEATCQIRNNMSEDEYYTKVMLFRGDASSSSYYYFYLAMVQNFFTKQCYIIGLDEESFIIFRNNGATVTRRRTYDSVEKCFSEQIIYDEFSENELIDKILTMNSYKAFIPTSNILINDTSIQNKYLTLLTGQPNDSVVIGTLFSENYFYNLFNIPNLPANTFFYIKDNSDKILISKNLKEMNPEILEGTDEIIFDDVAFNVIQYSMDSIGCKAVIGIPDSYFNEMLVPLKVLNIRYSVIAIGIGILLSIIFTLYNYMPLKKLIDIPSLADHSRKKLQGNEYKYIRELMENSNYEIQKLRNNIKDMDNTLRVNLFVRLLHGNVNGEGEVKLAMQLIPQLSSEYRIAIIKVNINNDNLNDIDYLSFLVYDQMAVFLSSDYLFGQLDRTKTAVLIPGTKQRDHHFTEIVKEINNKLSNHNITLTAGISEVSTGIDKINSAFYHAQFSLFQKSEDLFCYYTAITVTEPLSIDLIGLQRLHELVIAGKYKEVEDMLEKVSYVLINGETSTSEDIKKTFYMVCFVLESATKNMQCKTVTLPEYNKNETVQELFSALGSTAYKIAMELDERKQNANQEYKQDVINYIKSNFTSKSICAETIENAFGISKSNLYKLVKDYTGYTLNDYIKKLRTEKAAEMLRETDLPVSSLSDICGFDVLRTFYREFKKQYGVTPSQFRENTIEKADHKI